ncbi:unnamed protein product [Camellia sinensis]
MVLETLAVSTGSSSTVSACDTNWAVFSLKRLDFLRKSIFMVNSVVIPTLQWILPDQCPHSGSQKLYSDVAKHGFLVIGKYGPTFAEMPIQPELLSSSNATQMDKCTDIGGYGRDWNRRTGLFSPPFELFLLGGYKWIFSGLSLDKRLDFFESNWIFFAGFGNPCVLAIFLFSPLVSYGVMAIVFPLVQMLTNSLLLKEANRRAQ